MEEVEDNWHQLAQAVDDDDIDEVRRLLQSGANPNFSFEESTIVGLAIAQSNPEILRLILDMGGNPNVVEDPEDGSTAMHLAPIYNLEMLRILIEKGGDVNIRDIKGQTPLFNVRDTNEPDDQKIIDLLLSSGADPMARDNNGDTVLGYKAKNAKLMKHGRAHLALVCTSPILSPPHIIAEVDEKYPGALSSKCRAKAAEFNSQRVEPSMRRLEAQTGKNVPAGISEKIGEYAYGMKTPRYETRSERMAPAMSALESQTNKTYDAPPGTYTVPSPIVRNVKSYLFPPGPSVSGSGMRKQKRRKTNRRRKTKRHRRTSKK
jgi:hypothetical protein